MTRAAYTGSESRTFPDYLDRGTGKVLRADPGGIYDVTPASGHAAGEVGPPWFRVLEDPAAAGEPVPEPVPGPEPGEPAAPAEPPPGDPAPVPDGEP